MYNKMIIYLILNVHKIDGNTNIKVKFTDMESKMLVFQEDNVKHTV